MKRALAGIFVCLFLLGSCTSHKSTELAETTERTKVEEVTAGDTREEISEGIPYDQFTSYASILEEYRRVATYAIEDQGKGESWYTNEWLGGLIKSNSGKAPIKDDFGYAIHDLNGNGNPELILMLREYIILAIFSTVDGKLTLLDDFEARHYCAIDSSGMIFTHTSGGATTWSYSIQKISPDDSQLLLVEEYGNDGSATGDGYYKIENGEPIPIDKEALDDFLETNFHDFQASVVEMTKNSGTEFIALF